MNYEAAQRAVQRAQAQLDDEMESAVAALDEVDSWAAAQVAMLDHHYVSELERCRQVELATRPRSADPAPASPTVAAHEAAVVSVGDSQMAEPNSYAAQQRGGERPAGQSQRQA